jgi:GTP pyrophosphokinase
MDPTCTATPRTFCLTFHDVRAVVVELAYRVDALRNAARLPKTRRTALALETMQLYAPMVGIVTRGCLIFSLPAVMNWCLECKTTMQF